MAEFTLIFPSVPLSADDVLGVLEPSVVIVTFPLPKTVSIVPAKVVSIVIFTGSINHSSALISTSSIIVNSFPEVSIKPPSAFSVPPTFISPP